MRRLLVILTIWICCYSCIYVGAQTIGTDICACQPGVYTFKFNFSAVCEIQTIERPGIRGADCFTRGTGSNAENITDTVPVSVSTISVLELDRQLRPLAQTPYTGTYSDGETFSYTSIAGTLEGAASLTPDSFPAGIQLDIAGINRLEEPITNVWIILFDNDCNTFPVLMIGDTIGWSILFDYQGPLQKVCPIASTIPTLIPSNIPSLPTIYPQPSAPPTETPGTTAPTKCIPYPTSKSKGKSRKSGTGSGKGGSKTAGSKSSKTSSDERSRQLGQSSEHGTHNWYFTHMEMHETGFPAEARSIGTGNDPSPDSDDTPKIPYCEEPPPKKKSKTSKESTRSKLHKSKTSKMSKSEGKGDSDSDKSNRSKMQKSNSLKGSKSRGKAYSNTNGSLKSRSKYTKSKMKGKKASKLQKKANSSNESARSKLQKTKIKGASKRTSDGSVLNGGGQTYKKKSQSPFKADQRLYKGDSFFNDTASYPEVSPRSNSSTILPSTTIAQLSVATSFPSPIDRTVPERASANNEKKWTDIERGNVRNLRRTPPNT